MLMNHDTIYVFLQEVAFLLWKESWELGKNPMASKGSPLHIPRTKLIDKAHSLFAETKEHTFESKAAEEHAKLLKSVQILVILFVSEYSFLKLGKTNSTESFSIICPQNTT